MRTAIRSVVTTATLVASAASSAPGQDAQEALLVPPPTDGPLPVEATFRLLDIVDVSDRDQQFEFEGVLRLRWLDQRLAFDPAEFGADIKVYQGDYQFSEIGTGWWPQVILENEAGAYDRQAVILRVEPDGTSTYIEEFHAIAEARADLRRLPFDRRAFPVMFEMLGFGSDRVSFVIGPPPESPDSIHYGQWSVAGFDPEPIVEAVGVVVGNEGRASRVTFDYEGHRSPWYLLRVIVFPIAMLVALSWSVFWMSSSSLGDRLAASFIGILTVIAFQIVVSDAFPQIAYMTLLDAFLYVSYATLVGGVLVNLRVDVLDRRGHHVAGDRLDRTCRWAFPLGYSVALAVTATVFLTRG